MNDYLTYKAVENDDNKCVKTLAWVIGIAVAFVVIALFWNGMRKEQVLANNRAIDAAVNVNARVGILEGNQAAVGQILNNTTANVSQLLQEAAANATNVAAQGRILAEATETRARGFYPYGCGCGNNGLASAINPRFRQVNEYQQCNSRLYEENTCGNAGA